MDLKIHTLILLVGPTNCGKTHFTQNYLIPQIRSRLSESFADKGLNLNIQHVSSDSIRSDLLGLSDSINKYDPRMLEISSASYDLLFHKLDLAMSFPINAHFVIVDTTALQKVFRDRISALARSKSYYLDVVIFNYKDFKDYYDAGGDRSIITTHISKLKNKVLKDMTNNIHKKILIKKKGSYPSVTIANVDSYLSHILDPTHRYVLVGNLTEGIQKLKQLLIDTHYEINNNFITETEISQRCGLIIVGEIGGDPDIIQFLHQNLLSAVPIYLVQNASDRRTLDLIKQAQIDDGQSVAFNLMKDRSDIQSMFEDLQTVSKTFWKYCSSDKYSHSFVVVSSVCDPVHLEKMDPFSSAKQIGLQSDKASDIPDSFHMPYIITARPTIQSFTFDLNSNRIMIGSDKTTAVLVGYNMKTPKFFEDRSNLSHIFFKKFGLKSTENLKIEDIIEGLDDREIRRLKFLIKSKINYVSGTIAPAAADHTQNNFESLAKAVEYFYTALARKKISMKLSLQPKYMGSRCNVYVFRDLSKCHATSRNGYAINIDMTQIFERLHTKLSPLMEANQIEMMLIDAELMPWNALGKKLISKTFAPTAICLSKTLSKLESYGFEESYTKLSESMAQTDFATEINKISSKDLYEKYGGARFNTFRALSAEQKRHIDIPTLKSYHKTYVRQLEVYGTDAEPYLKPFGILKVELTDGTAIVVAHGSYEPLVIDSKIIGQTDAFGIISTDEQCVLDTSEPIETSIQKAQGFFEGLMAEGRTEGIVMKPDFCYEDLAPCLKVRNPDYLHLIYGYDYLDPTRFPKLLSSKNTSKKLSISIREYNLGVRMLAVPQSEISSDNLAYQKLLKDFLFLEKTEQGLDPRL